MLLQITERIDCDAVLSDLKMAVIARAPAGASHLGDHLPLSDLIAHGNAQLAVVTVIRHIAVAVVDLNQISVAAGVIAGVDYSTAVRSQDI